MSDSSKVNKWIFEYLPEELQNAFNMKFTETTTEGRKEAIESDNINDFAQHGSKKKFFWKSDGYRHEIKTDDGKKVSPIRYAYQKKAYKCYAFLLIHLDYREHFYLHSIGDIFKKRTKLPYWYILFLFSIEPKRELDSVDFIDKTMYFLLFKCPKENDRYLATGFLKEIQICIKEYKYKFKRSDVNEQKDIEFYHNLSNNDKKILKQLVYNYGAFDLNLDQCLMEEGDLDIIFHFFKPYQFCEYIIKTGKHDELVSWIKANRKEIKYETCAHMIMPQFRQIYPIIFKGIKIKQSESDDDYFMAEHFRNLIKHKFVQEVKFFLDQGMFIDIGMVELLLESCHPELLQILERIDKGKVQHAFDNLYGRNDICVQYHMENGFHPSIDGIVQAYSAYNNKNAQNLDIIELIPPDKNLDILKKPIAQWHFDLVDEFISKYSHRFAKTSIDSWNVKKKHHNYKKLCAKLGVDYESDSPRYESSDSYNGRKISNASRCQKSSEKVELVNFTCCSKCSGKNLCAVCHQSSVTYNPAYVCKKHKNTEYRCPICHEKGYATSQSRLCNKCFQKYRHKCIKC